MTVLCSACIPFRPLLCLVVKGYVFIASLGHPSSDSLYFLLFLLLLLLIILLLSYLFPLFLILLLLLLIFLPIFLFNCYFCLLVLPPSSSPSLVILLLLYFLRPCDCLSSPSGLPSHRILLPPTLSKVCGIIRVQRRYSKCP